MTTIQAVVRHGRIEVDRLIDLPDGTELKIPIPGKPATLGIRDEDWRDTPEEIDAWIRWFDSLEPVEFTVAERSAWDNARREQKQLELAQWEQQGKRIEGVFR